MANQVYPKFLEHALEVSLNGTAAAGSNIKACLVTSGYTYNSAHDFLDDLGANITNGGYPSGASANLSVKTFTNGVFDADAIVFTETTGTAAAALVLFIDTGVLGTSRLVAYFDTIPGFPITLGGDITLNSPTGFFNLAPV